MALPKPAIIVHERVLTEYGSIGALEKPTCYRGNLKNQLRPTTGEKAISTPAKGQEGVNCLPYAGHKYVSDTRQFEAASVPLRSILR